MTSCCRFRCPIAILVLLGAPMKEAFASEWIPEKRPSVDEQVAETPILQPKEEFEPLWEVVVGGAVGWTPDYPAAGQNHVRAIPPLPLPIFRGERFQAGERSIARGLFINTGRVELDLGFSGSLPADSSDNKAREGMDDLDFLAEIGPTLSYYIDRDDAGNQLRFDISLRALLSTDFKSGDYVGLVLYPYLAQEFVDVMGIQALEANWSIGARWADDGVMDLFYEVPVADANDDRAAFNAKGGYLGTTLYGAFSYLLTERLRTAFGVSIASYHGATNSESDLFIDEFNVGVGLALIWTAWQSETRSKVRK